MAIVAVLVLTMIIYVLVATVAVLAMVPGELAASDAPLADLYTQSTGQPATVISLVGLFAVVNGALIQIIMAARVLYGMSRAHWLPDVLGRVHPWTQTPLIATAAVVAIVLVFALALPIVRLAEMTSLATLTIFFLVNIACIVIKRRHPAAPGAFVIPTWVPYAGSISTCGLAMAQIISFAQ
jgi:amino acid transporter